MTSRERMTAALKGKPTDRVPLFPCIYIDHACHAKGRDYAEALADPRVGVAAMLDAALLYGCDVVRVRATPPRSWFAEKKVRRAGEDLVQIDRRSGRVEGRFDVQGGGKLIPVETPEPIRDLDQAKAITWPSADALIDDGCMDAAREVTERAHEKGLFVVGMAGGQTINPLVDKVGGTEAALLTLVDQPELANAIMDAGTAASIELGRAFARIGVDGLYIGDSYASGSVISPAMYDTFCAPRYTKAAEAARANGLLVYAHCCGDYNPLLRILRKEPLHGMEGMDPTSGMTVAHTREALGDAMCLIGGVSCLSLLQGTPSSVRAEALACIRDGGPRYVLGSACAVPRFSPAANLKALAQAAFDSPR